MAALALSVACQKVPLLAPAGSTITLTTASSTLPINGSTDVIAQIIEAGGVPPHEGTRVTFTTSLGRLQPSEADTDVGGRAIVKFIATTSGVASITALSGGTSIAAANAVKISVGAAAVGGVSLQANPTTLSSAGGTTDLTATVIDTSGNPLPGVSVTFSIDTSATTSSGAGSFSASVVTTDANGRATTQLTTNRTTTVAATAGVATTGGGTGGTAASAAQTAKVTINVNSTATITVGTVVPATPSVNQAVTVPLTYGTTGSPITRVTVNWGDGTTSSVPGQPAAVSHTYSQSGTFGVQITGTDAFGDAANTATSITVSSSRPTVTVTPPSTGVHAGAPATFTIAAAVPTGSTASIASVTIDWGDGTSTTVPSNIGSAQHTYSAALVGTTVTVTVTARDTNGQPGGGSTVVTVQS